MVGPVRSIVAWFVTFLMFAGAAGGSTLEERTVHPPPGAPVLWESGDTGSGALDPSWAAAIRGALRAAASDAGLELCAARSASGAQRQTREGPCEIRSSPQRELSWTADVATRESGSLHLVVIALSLEIRPGGDLADGLGTRQIAVELPQVLPSELDGDAAQRALAARSEGPLRDDVGLKGWFQEIATALGGGGGPRPTSGPSEPAASPAPAARPAAEGEPPPVGDGWTAVERKVIDLVFAGDLRGAARAAEAGLENRDLAPGPAARVGDLRRRALSESLPEPAAAEVDVTIPVRAAATGGGFVQGGDGRLRISGHGIGFVPDRGADGAWFVAWSQFRGARPAEGIWDVRWPVEIRTSAGSRFVTELAPDGGLADGRSLLSWIARGQAAAGASGDGG